MIIWKFKPVTPFDIYIGRSHPYCIDLLGKSIGIERVNSCSMRQDKGLYRGLRYLSYQGAAKAQASLHICADLSEPWLLAYTIKL